MADRPPGRGALTGMEHMTADVPPVNPPRRSLLWLLLVWLAVAGLLYLALHDTPLPQILSALRRLGAAQILALAALNLGILLVMALRWWILLRSLGARLPLPVLLAYRLAGFGVSYFTPGPQFGGEPLQVHLLHSRRGVPLPTAISSVFLDRLVDLLANFTFLVLGVAVVLLVGLVDGTGWRAIPFALVGLVLLPVGHLLALWLGRRPFTHVADGLARRWPALNRAAVLVRQSEEQIGQLCRAQPVVILAVIALSIFLWGAYIFEFWLTLNFLGLTATPVEAVSALTAARLSILLPLPAALGALEAGQALAAQLLGWGAAFGVAVSLVIRARDVFIGLLGLWIGGFAYRAFLLRGILTKERR